MEIKIIDHNYRCVALIDTFTSLIWTERFNAPGDFELECPLNSEAVNWASNGYFAEIDESDYSMIIEEVNLVSDYENGKTMTIKGRTLDSILDRRSLDTFDIPNGKLGNTLYMMFRRAIQNVLGTSGKLLTIPEFNYIFPTDTAIANTSVNGDFSGKTLLEAVQDILAGTGLGFSMKRYISTSERGVEDMHYNFELYTGKDRSVNQNTTPKVIFASELDNMISSTYNKSVSLYKNAAMITGDSNETERRTLLYIPGLDWSYGSVYSVDDVVRYEDDELFYRCITSHTATDSNCPKQHTIWTANKAYVVGDIVYDNYDSKFYRCKLAIAKSQTHPASDTTHWDTSVYWAEVSVDDILDLVVSGLNLRVLKVDAADIPMTEEIKYDAWASGSSYTIGKIVTVSLDDDEIMYFKCTKTHSNSQLSPIGTKGLWTEGKSYAVNDIVYDDADDKLYRCKMAINQSSSHPDDDKTHWETTASNWIADDPETEQIIPIHRYNKYLAQRGLEELYAANEEVETYSGEAEPIGTFEYGRDFFIGDIVTIVNDFGMPINVRVTEVIRSEDQNGVTVVPTFSA